MCIRDSTKTDYPTGSGNSGPNAVAYDGTNIWVTNFQGNNVSKIDPVTGTKVDYPTSTGNSHPFGIIYDATNIWVTNYSSNDVSKMNPG